MAMIVLRVILAMTTVARLTEKTVKMVMVVMMVILMKVMRVAVIVKKKMMMVVMMRMMSDEDDDVTMLTRQRRSISIRRGFVAVAVCQKLRAAFTDKAWSEGVISTSYNVV